MDNADTQQIGTISPLPSPVRNTVLEARDANALRAEFQNVSEVDLNEKLGTNQPTEPSSASANEPNEHVYTPPSKPKIDSKEIPTPADAS